MNEEMQNHDFVEEENDWLEDEDNVNHNVKENAMRFQ